MIGYAKGYKIEIHARPAPKHAENRVDYYVQIHCWCQSTLSSGEYLPSIDDATATAVEAMDDHERTGNHARGYFHIECVDCASVAYVSFDENEIAKPVPLCRDCQAARKAIRKAAVRK